MRMDDEVAVVGVGGRFPGADNIDEFWEVLSKGENHVLEIPKERWNVDAFYDPDQAKPGKSYVRRAGMLKNYDKWDHKFFGINDIESDVMDPQQKLVLECVHMAMEDGGILRKDLENTRTGVYIGVMNDDFKVLMYQDPENIDNTYMVTGLSPSILSARVSYVYNLFGPAITIDTACSSSLVAIDIGCQALLTGQCTAVICGGVNSLLDPMMFTALSKARMVSPTGQCHTFSADADGYARGEGCGIVILKLLKDALKDNNKVWATLRTGTNQDGRTASPITSPSGTQQMDLLRHVYCQSGIDKASVQVIEAHGTGTPVGDPIEANALGFFFSSASRSMKYIGSVKTNIGHLEAAAGVAGIVKVLLMMKHGLIVPSLMFTEDSCNPKINFKQYNLCVPTAVTPWQCSTGSSRRAAVNSFGFGGTNAHAVLTQFPTESTADEQNVLENELTIVAVSAVNAISLRDNIRSFVDDLEKKDVNLKALGYTSTCRRQHYHSRIAFVVKTQQELESKCTNFLKLEINEETKHKKKVFVFCGVGTAWKGMCKSLMQHAIFRGQIDAVDDFLEKYTGWRIGSKFESNEDVTADPLVAHVAIFSCQLGLAALWKHFGIVPDTVIGQSVGEVAAAYVSGSLTLRDAVKVIYYRSLVLSQVTGGAMMVIKGYPTNKVHDMCSFSRDSASIAVFSSSEACTVSGSKDELVTLKSRIQAERTGKNCTFIELDVQCAYHSKHVERVKNVLINHLRDVKFKPPNIPVLSTVSGSEVDKLFASADYWGRNIREPVQFKNAIIKSASGEGATLFIEIGPNPVLRSHLNSLFGESVKTTVSASMKRGHELDTLYEAVCSAFIHGEEITWPNIVTVSRQLTSLPRYKFQAVTRMLKSKTLEMKSQGLSGNEMGHLYVVRMPDKQDTFQFKATINPETTPFIYEHIIRSNIVVPGAFYADIGFKIGKSVIDFVSDKCLNVSLYFKKPVRLIKDDRVDLNVNASLTQSDSKDIEISFKVKHANDIVCYGSTWYSQTNQPKRVNIAAIKSNLTKGISAEEMYNNLEKLGFQYGRSFRIMQSCMRDECRCIVDLILPESVERTLDQTFIHPCILDSMLQSCVNVIQEETLDTAHNLAVFPLGIKRVIIYRKPHGKMLLYMRRKQLTITEGMLKIHFNAVLLGYDGEVVAEMINYIVFGRMITTFSPNELKYQVQWMPMSKPVKRETQRLFSYIVCGLSFVCLI